MITIRTDGNQEIGAGHIMRCTAIAREVQKLGHKVVFAVSDNQSAQLVKASGMEIVVLGGNPQMLTTDDASVLIDYAKTQDISGVLVDSYAVTQTFFSTLSENLAVTYIDDAYTFADGFLDVPKKWGVARVVNYGFGYSEADYRAIYGKYEVDFLIGPAFAPIREEFANRDYFVSENVERILVTCGSTNPNQSLERMVQGCRNAVPDAQIDVVVGRMAEFNSSVFDDDQLVLHNDVRDMASLMLSANLAVSAAGSTLYELCCIGVPTVALPIVDNQTGNARGFSALHLGESYASTQWGSMDVSDLVRGMASNATTRESYSDTAKHLVDGVGAARIAAALV